MNTKQIKPLSKLTTKGGTFMMQKKTGFQVL